MSTSERTIVVSFWAIVGVAAVFVAGFAYLAIQYRDLSRETRTLGRENRSRITDIQGSRIRSCEHTYEGVREVFKPFFPPRKDLKGEQLTNARTFSYTIKRLKANCTAQTNPTNGKEAP